MAEPIADFQLPIARLATGQLEIDNRQSAILKATRYREVVLTSCLVNFATLLELHPQLGSLHQTPLRTVRHR